MRSAALASITLLALLAGACRHQPCADGSTVAIAFSGVRPEQYTATLVMAGRRLHLECPETATLEGLPVSCHPDGILVTAVGVDIDRVTHVMLTVTSAGGALLAHDVVIALPAPMRLHPEDNSCQRAAVVGLGGPIVETVLKVNRTSHDFGAVAVGSTSPPVTFVVSNVGSGVIAAPQATTTSDDYVVVSPCTSAVPPAGSCGVGVVFRPLSPGTQNDSVTIVSGPDLVSVALTGIGIVADAGAD